MGPIPSYVLKDLTHLQLMPVFQVLFSEKPFKVAIQACCHLFISSRSHKVTQNQVLDPIILLEDLLQGHQ